MERFKLKDRYINGTVAFEANGETAVMSYLGLPTLPVNSIYKIGENSWRVVQVRTSNYNPQVVNVDMVLEGDK